ncbi:unnamed protein product [Rhizopus stolonifer]
MNPENVTNAEMESQFRERNNNLRNDVNQLVNKATSQAQNVLQNTEMNMDDKDIKNATHNHTFDRTMGFQRRQSWIDSVKGDIQAMHSRDPDRFGSISSRFDETFGNSL